MSTRRQSGFIKKWKSGKIRLLQTDQQNDNNNKYMITDDDQFPQFNYNNRRWNREKNDNNSDDDDNEFSLFVFDKKNKKLPINTSTYYNTKYNDNQQNSYNNQWKVNICNNQSKIQFSPRHYCLNNRTKPVGKLVTNAKKSIHPFIKQLQKVRLKNNQLQSNRSISSTSEENQVNKIQNKLLFLSLSSHDESDSSSLSSIESKYDNEKANKNYKPQFIQQQSSKKYISRSSTLKNQHKSTPLQFVKQIQNRTQKLKRQQLMQQYKKQGISVAKGGLTFDIDTKQFAINNNINSPKGYQGSQNQNQSNKVTKNSALIIRTKSNKNKIQSVNYKKTMNSTKQELKKRRQLAKCYDRYARYKVFGNQ